MDFQNYVIMLGFCKLGHNYPCDFNTIIMFGHILVYENYSRIPYTMEILRSVNHKIYEKVFYCKH